MFSAGRNRSSNEGPYRMGFLEELYLDRFDKARYQGLAFPPPDPGAEEIIGHYRELIKGFPPLKLEKDGSIPEQLMEGLKKIGLFGLNIPEKYGGVGLGLGGYLSVLRTMSRTDMALALTPTAHLSNASRDVLARAASSPICCNAKAQIRPEAGSSLTNSTREPAQ